MPSRLEIISFDESPPPPGRSPFVPGAQPQRDIDVVDPDPGWAASFETVAERVREALGWRALVVEHVGSTSVPGLAAKPVIDLDLTVADPDDEPAYVPALEAAGFELRVREPWWHGHRLLRFADPRAQVHVFGYDSPELVKHRLFRDWLRGNPDDRDLYARTKRDSAAAANAAGEDTMQYNARKQAVIREIYGRAFRAAGLIS